MQESANVLSIQRVPQKRRFARCGAQAHTLTKLSVARSSFSETMRRLSIVCGQQNPDEDRMHINIYDQRSTYR